MHTSGIKAAFLTLVAVACAGSLQAQGAGPPVTAADIRFMQEMTVHHRQAVEMTALLRRRTRSPRMRSLAERIEVSQTDELAMMRRWLESHGSAPSGAGGRDMAAHGGHAMAADSAMPSMPGMLTPAELRTLTAARGARFDRLFLTGMIKHHEGALSMVSALQATPGAAQESSVNSFVIEVDTDQRAEIARMRRLLSGR